MAMIMRARGLVDRGTLGVAACLAALPFLLGACGRNWQDQQITSVEVRPDERTLVVGYHCHEDASIAAEETGEEVRLTLRVAGDHRGECADVEEVQLGAPLGERRVIDASTEAEVAPCHASTLPGDPPCS